MWVNLNKSLYSVGSVTYRHTCSEHYSGSATVKEISPGCSLDGLILKLKLQYFGPPHAKSWPLGKDPDAGRDWGQKEKGTTEDEMVGWYHWLDGPGFGWTLGVGDGQGGLACCNSWGRRESDTTERLNWTKPKKRWRNWKT